MNHFDPALLRELIAVLQGGQIEDAELEAKWILEDADSAAQARDIAQHRAKHEPLQYLLGKWEFYGLTVFVGKGVLIPRSDTETLVDAVLSRVKDSAGQCIADLCTGSGCIALALAAHMPQTAFTGTDISEDALQYARKNKAYHNMQNAEFVCADVLSADFAAKHHDLAAIVCNPPYLTAADMQQLQAEVRHEPETALYGDTDGLHFYREITCLWKQTLCAGGLLAFEIGCTQGEAVAEILSAYGFTGVETIRDLNGNDRVVLGRRS